MGDAKNSKSRVFYVPKMNGTMKEENICEIPYRKASATVATIILLTLDDLNGFPLWCEDIGRGVFSAVPLLWALYAWIHKDRVSAIIYSLMSFIIAFIYFILR